MTRMPGRCECFQQAFLGGIELRHGGQSLDSLSQIQEAKICIEDALFGHKGAMGMRTASIIASAKIELRVVQVFIIMISEC
jgi:hypothetical protein